MTGQRATYKYFYYFNPNPIKTRETGDCSIRSLCVATNKSWLDVYDKLASIGRKNFTVMSDMGNIKEFLEDEGFTPCKVTVKKGSRRPTMRELIKQYPGKIIFGQCSSHVMCARNGKVMDIWDSSLRPLYKYWLKEE